MTKHFLIIFLMIPLTTAIFCKENLNNKLTIANLKAALMCEIRDYKKYSDYAKKAKEEGYTDLGNLFHSLSGFEKQHARIYMEILENYGIKIDTFEIMDIDKYSVGSSVENLRHSINNEKRDVNDMFDKFAKTAREEKMYDAADTISQITLMENKNIQMLQDFSISFKPVGRNKKASIGTTKRINF